MSKQYTGTTPTRSLSGRRAWRQRLATTRPHKTENTHLDRKTTQRPVQTGPDRGDNERQDTRKNRMDGRKGGRPRHGRTRRRTPRQNDVGNRQTPDTNLPRRATSTQNHAGQNQDHGKRAQTTTANTRPQHTGTDQGNTEQDRDHHGPTKHTNTNRQRRGTTTD